MPPTETLTAEPSQEGAVPPGVRVHTLGRFLIEVDGAPLRFETKARRKPLELLKVLVAQGGDSVPAEPLIESLWPDSDGDRAHSAFTTTLGRLRKLIGAAPVILQDGRLSLQPQHCWVDAHAFAAALEAAGEALHAADGDAAWAHLERALALYRGPFLEGEFDPPEILSARERLHGLFLRHIEKLAQFFAERGETARATALYQQGLEVDDLAEELYRHLMRAYLEQGRLVEGVAVYKRCKQIFRASVGIDPSPETEALHQALLAAQAERQAAPPEAPAPPPPPATGPPGALPTAAAPPSPDPAALPRPGPAAGTPPHTEAPRQEREAQEHTRREAERRPATLAVYHLAGYRALSERLDPEDAQELMEHLRAETARIVNRHGGLLNEFVRDEAVALFGVPTAHEDDAVRAVRAAQELQTVAHSLSVQVEPTTGHPLRFRTGLHTGLILAQPREDDGGLYDVTGGAVTAAGELAARAAPDEVLVSAATQRLIRDFFATEPGAALTLPGHERPLETFRVAAPTGALTRLDAAVQRGLSEFTGRGEELAQLQACLAKACAGEGQFVTIVGEPGLGKSRLLHEFVRTLDRGQITLVEARALASGSDTPYMPHQDGLRSGLGLRDTPAPAAERAAQAVQRVLAIDPALEPYIPYYLYLLALSSPEHPLPERLTAEELRQGLHDALVALAMQSAARRPVVIIHEDWHWVDDSSLAGLRSVVSMMGTQRLLLIVTYRPDFQVRWGNLSYHTQILLRPLGEAQTRSVMQSALGGQEIADSWVARVHERTGGNPFFIEEICTSLREEGAVEVVDGVVRLTRSPRTVALPDTVQAVIRSRIDRLSHDDQRTLRLAAVIGREFQRSLLERIAAQDVPLAECLERLKQAELVQQTQVVPEAAFRFKHVLTQFVAYETLLVQQRRKLHGLVGEALEALHAERLEEHGDALAYHFARSTDAARAIHYLRLAGDRAAAIYALDDARSHYRAALERLDTLSTDPERQRERIALSLQWAAVSYYAATLEHLQVFRRSLDYAQALDDPELVARVTYWYGRLHAVVGHTEEAGRLYEQALALAQRHGLDEIALRARHSIGRISVHTGEYARGVQYLEDGLEPLLALGDTVEWIFSVQLLGRIHGTMGHFERCFALLREAVEKSRALGNLTQESAALAHLGWMKALQGHWPEAIRYSDEGTAQARRIGNRLITSEGTIIAGYARFMMGGQDEGIALMQRGLELRQTPGFIGVLTFNAYLAEVLALAGRTAEAEEAARRLLHLREQAGSKSGDITTQRALALLRAQGDSPDWNAAREHIGAAIALASERGAQPDLALAHFRAAQVERAHGDAEAARTYLEAATSLFRELGMTWWLEQAQALATAPAARASRPARAGGARSRSGGKAARGTGRKAGGGTAPRAAAAASRKGARTSR